MRTMEHEVDISVVIPMYNEEEVVNDKTGYKKESLALNLFIWVLD